MTLEGWSEPAFAGVAEMVSARTGLAFAPSRRDDAEDHVRRAMAKSGIAEVTEYLDRLRRGMATFEDLIVELTVPETYFMREPAQLDFIRTVVLPELRASRAAGHILRAWSAGCATGEEAYSLAIVFTEAGLEGRARVLATDISVAALSKARAASYGNWSFRGTDTAFARAYFRREGARFVLHEGIRSQVAVEYLNLAADGYPSASRGTASMDLILCRNVLFYLEPATIALVARRLFDALAEGGWLITGPSDPWLAEHAPFEVVITEAGVFYRHPAAGDEFAGAPDPRTPDEVAAPQPLPFLEPTGAGSCADTRPSDEESARDAFARGSWGDVAELTRDAADSASLALRVRALANHAGSVAAEQCAVEAVQRHPLSAELHFLHGMLLVDLGRDDDAIKAVRRATYLDRSLAMSHFTLGELLQRRGDAEGAHRAYRNARDLCAACPREVPLALADGQLAGQLADAAASAMERLVTQERSR